MLSHKILNLQRLLELAVAGEVRPTRAVICSALRMVVDCRERAEALEATVVPRRQRLQLADLNAGNVTLFPKAPRPEAQL